MIQFAPKNIHVAVDETNYRWQRLYRCNGEVGSKPSPQVVHPKQKMLLMSYQQAACQSRICLKHH
jgi:hypothetical protein